MTKVHEAIRIVEEDGWVYIGTRGSHRQFKHPTKRGRVTIPGRPSKELPTGIWHSILRQAGLKGTRR